MKKQLLASSALIGAGLIVSPAMAADRVKLGIGGFFSQAYIVEFGSASSC
jgi:outer membrane protein OmpU